MPATEIALTHLHVLELGRRIVQEDIDPAHLRLNGRNRARYGSGI